jgi:RNA polymerase-binding transcription factor DksA
MKKKTPTRRTKITPRRATQRNQPRAATSSQVLGRAAFKPAPDVTDRIARKWRPHYRRLMELRRRLLDQAGGLAEEAVTETPRYSMHMADSGTDSFDRDFAFNLLTANQNALYEIEQALARIENGTYGMCELTQKPIAKERLAAIPWTRFSAKAQKGLEQEGLVERPHLGKLGSVKGSEEAELAAEEEP